MNMIEDIIVVNINTETYKIPKPETSFVELWNPKVAEVQDLCYWLEVNRKICYIWCYGFDDGPEYDFSGFYHSRVVVPMWLGRTQEEAYDLYTKAFKNLVAGTMSGGA